jgi:hypothetical protein
MHKNETFLKDISEEELLLLMFEAEALGPKHMAALTEQIQRLDEE